MKRCLYRILKMLYDVIRRSGNAVALIKLQYPVDYTFGSHKLIGLTPPAKTSIWPICLLTRNTICHRCFNIEPNLWKVSHMLLSKMVDVLQTKFWSTFSRQEGFVFWFQFSTKFFAKGTIYNKSAMVKTLTNDEAIHWRIYIYIYIYMRVCVCHPASMCEI